jgi:hypothetical protein
MEVELKLLDRLRLMLQGYVYLEDRTSPSWEKALPFYVFKCHKHGNVVDYTHGYSGKLVCPLCVKELKSDRSLDLTLDHWNYDMQEQVT